MYLLQAIRMGVHDMSIRKAKVYITIDVDTEEYPIPADEQVEDEIQDQIESFIYDIDGLNLNQIKILIGD